MTFSHEGYVFFFQMADELMSFITNPASMKPKMAVMCAEVPLIWAFDEHHSWLMRSGLPAPLMALGHMQALVPQVLAVPLLGSTSGENTQRNFFFG